MTVKQIMSKLDLFIRQKEKTYRGLVDPKMSWNEHPTTAKLSQVLSGMIQNDIDYIIHVKKELDLFVVNPNEETCSHPKQDRDIVDGQSYCMNCNQNL